MKLRILVLVGILCISSSVQAIPSTLTATSNGAISGFTIGFNDTGNSIFDFSELVSFSGFTFAGFNFDTVLTNPFITDISNGSGNAWMFRAPDAFANFNTNFWTYEITSDTVSVPEPITMALMGLGLIGLGLSTRKANNNKT